MTLQKKLKILLFGLWVSGLTALWVIAGDGCLATKQWQSKSHGGICCIDNCCCYSLPPPPQSPLRELLVEENSHGMVGDLGGCGGGGGGGVMSE